jgi:hypothetical protein
MLFFGNQWITEAFGLFLFELSAPCLMKTMHRAGSRKNIKN